MEDTELYCLVLTGKARYGSEWFEIQLRASQILKALRADPDRADEAAFMPLEDLFWNSCELARMLK